MGFWDKKPPTVERLFPSQDDATLISYVDKQHVHVVPRIGYGIIQQTETESHSVYSDNFRQVVTAKSNV